MVELERRHLTQEYRIPIRDKVMVVTVDVDKLKVDTKDLEYGPCIVNMNYQQFRRVWWSRMPYEVLPISRYTRHLAYVISRWFGKPLFTEQSLAFMFYNKGYSEIFINPYDTILKMEREGKPTDEIIAEVKALIIESYNHEREHTNQYPPKYPPICWTFEELKFSSRLKLALFDLEGSMLNLAFIYIMADSGFSVPLRIGAVIMPFILSAAFSSIRDILLDDFIHRDSDLEIEANLAESCPIVSPVFDFRLLSF